MDQKFCLLSNSMFATLSPQLLFVKATEMIVAPADITECYVLTGLNAFVYTGFNTQQL